MVNLIGKVEHAKLLKMIDQSKLIAAKFSTFSETNYLSFSAISQNCQLNLIV